MNSALLPLGLQKSYVLVGSLIPGGLGGLALPGGLWLPSAANDPRLHLSNSGVGGLKAHLAIGLKPPPPGSSVTSPRHMTSHLT